MTTTHDRRVYRDGPDGNTPINSAGLNADQDTLVGLVNDVSDLADQVGNVGSGGNTLLNYVTGTTADRAAVPPTIGTVFLNQTRKIPEWGWGTEWRNPDGTTITAAGGAPAPGTSNAPQNSRATVNSDNSIDVAADPVTAGTTRTYNLYETRQTTPLVTGLTTPASHRTPGGTGVYGYSWTCTVDGVEGAASNIAYCSLPFGTTVGTGGGATGGGAIDTPSEILRLGAEGGHWSLDVGYPSGNVSKDMATVEAGWSDTPYFLPVESNTGVQFRAPMNGGTTPGSNYPRVELRERNADGSKAAWNANSGSHNLSGTSKVTHFPPNKPQVVVAQIHDDVQDLVQVRVELDQWFLSIKGVKQSTPILTGYSLGTYVAWSISLTGTNLTIKLNGATKYSATHTFGANCYFKAGCYDQANTGNGNAASEYMAVTVQQNSLVLSHS